MTEDVEQITKTPVESNVKTKEKDPKKVAAGKKLAEYNRRAKEALKEKMKRDAEKATEPEERDEQSKDLTAAKLESAEGWIPEISFTTAISLVGIGLTALNMFMSYIKDTKVLSRDKSDPSTYDRQGVQPVITSKIPVPKMGML